MFLLEQSYFFWKRIFCYGETLCCITLLHGIYCVLLEDFTGCDRGYFYQSGNEGRANQMTKPFRSWRGYEHLLEPECFTETNSFSLSLIHDINMRKASRFVSKDWHRIRSVFLFKLRKLFLFFFLLFIFGFKFWYYIIYIAQFFL